MTKLDAVNEVLEGLGEPRITSLDTGGTSIEADAERIVDRTDRRIQGNGPGVLINQNVTLSGWQANVIHEKDYTPDGSNNIVLTNVLAFALIEPRLHIELTMRDGKLYDTENDTDQFTEDFTLAVIIQVDYPKLPPRLRDYIAIAASLDFQRWYKRGQVDDRYLRDELRKARAAAMREDRQHAGGVNVFDTREAKRMLGERQRSRDLL